VPITQTRIDTVKLKAAVALANQKVNEAFEILAPYLVVISDADRASTPRPRDGFPDAAGSLMQALGEHPDIAKVAGFDAAAVKEDLANVAELKTLAERVAEFNQRLSDSRLTWLAEAWMPSLTVYGVAKVVAENTPALRTVIAPLARIFAPRRNRATAPVDESAQ